MGTSRFCKNPNFAEPYNTVFLYFITTFAKSDNTWGFGGVRAQKLSKKCHFMDAKSVRKTLEILTNRKCYTDVTYHDYVPSWGDQFCKKLGCNSIRRIRNLLKWNRKPLHVMCYLALHHWLKLCTNRTSFGGVILENPPKMGSKGSLLGFC